MVMVLQEKSSNTARAKRSLIALGYVKFVERMSSFSSLDAGDFVSRLPLGLLVRMKGT